MDPVVDPEGNSYERTSIERWLESHETSPVTRAPLRRSHLTPNRSLKAVIDGWLNGKSAASAQAVLDAMRRRAELAERNAAEATARAAQAEQRLAWLADGGASSFGAPAPAAGGFGGFGTAATAAPAWGGKK